ncbi:MULTISPECIES: carbohydrate ABC transporter permease [unclassified Streptomyces]|uniref:carbohydrate ABC transporter permease n=1 Tax=unclassified Streptomyces TaxID=2593676 RepID=UPI000BACC1C2|nr:MULTISPECIES: sugar ABC transporter permease [unclassified Streptomyces]ASY34836.1 ABC transporter permease [Streptomyces sp. CLI2509]MYX22806.1 ABC transporter permease subunit [Streptomyces sp. SID8380]
MATDIDAAPAAVPPQPRVQAVKKPRARFRERRNEAAWGYLFVAPAVILFLIMGAYTVIYGFGLSFAQWNGFWPEWHWRGFKNYSDLLGGSPTYWPIVRKAATNTLWVVIGVPVLTVLLAFPLAIVLNSVKRFQGILRSIYFVPYVTTGIAVYFAWNYILEPGGAINLLLKAVGLGSLQEPQGWLGNPDTALPTMIVVMVWSAVPVAMLLYLTSLQSLDSSLIEAAQIDGAGWLRTTTSVIWPLMKPITVVVILLNVRDSLQGFQSFLIMTNGGPGDSTSVLGLETYRLAFLNEMSPTLGLASALGWLLFLAALVVAFINQRAMRRIG